MEKVLTGRKVQRRGDYSHRILRNWTGAATVPISGWAAIFSPTQRVAREWISLSRRSRGETKRPTWENLTAPPPPPPSCHLLLPLLSPTAPTQCGHPLLRRAFDPSWVTRNQWRVNPSTPKHTQTPLLSTPAMARSFEILPTSKPAGWGN